MRKSAFAVGILALSMAIACSPQKPEQKEKTPSVSQAQTQLVAAATAEASAACNSETSVKPIGSADFNGDGAQDVVVDWSETACAKTMAEVCSPTHGCLRQVWVESGGAKRSIFTGQALKVEVSTEGTPPALIVDQAGDVCGRPNSEICRTIFKWDVRTLSLQETERQVLAART